MRGKIGFITYKLSGKGGTETVLLNVVANLTKTNSIDVVIPSVVKDKNFFTCLDNLRVNYKCSNSNSFIKRTLFLLSYLIFTNSDTIVCFSSKSVKLAYYIKVIFRKKYKIYSWIHFSLKHANFINQIDLKYADCHLAISSGIKRQLMDLGIPEEKIFLIYNPAQKQDLLIKNIECNKEIKNLLYIGRLENKQKNITLLLDSLNDLSFKWQLDIYGDGPDAEMLKQYAKDNVKEYQNIVWHGWSQNPWSEIKQADILLLTSNYEGFPMILLESLSRGVPCISANCPTGPEDIIKQNVNGFLFRTNDKQDLIGKLNLFFKEQSQFEPVKIAESINMFYEDGYFKNLEGILANA